MRTELHPIGNGVSRLFLGGVTPDTLDEVESWLSAIELPQSERKAACRQIISDGYYAVSNVEYRVTVECKKNKE